MADTIGEHLHIVVKMRREPIETHAAHGEASAPVRARITRAQNAQMERWDALNQDVGADVLQDRTVRTKGAARLLDTARSKRDLSERRAETVLRVARTVADLARCKRVEAEHVAEALGFQRDVLDTSCAEPS